MVLVPIITTSAKIITISFPNKLIIFFLSKTFLMPHVHICKINITQVRIIGHKFIYISVNSPNSPTRSNLNTTMIINILPLQPISKFIGHLIYSLIHNA